MDENDIAQIEKIIGYTFNDKNLLVTAFTHTSYCNEHEGAKSYERLEFLGDSILNFIVAENLFYGTNSGEGVMSAIRSGVVSRKPLDSAVRAMGLNKYVLYGNGVRYDEFISDKKRSDVFESVLAAIYIDSGSFDAPRKFVECHLSDEIAQVPVDYKSKLYEIAQANKVKLEFAPVENIGDKSHPFFKSQAIYDGRVLGEGTGSSSKKAQQNAAKEICEKLAIEK